MGKVSRREGRRLRPRRTRAVSFAGADSLKITIVTAPVPGPEGPLLADDARLVRAAALYADEIELVSFGTLLLGGVAALAAKGLGAAFDMVGAISDETWSALQPGTNVKEAREALKTLEAMKRMSRGERRALLGPDGNRDISELIDQFTAVTTQGDNSLTAVAERMWAQPGGNDLLAAMDAGVLKLSAALDLGAETDVQTQQYVDALRSLLADPSTHLLLDAGTSSLASAMLTEDEAEIHPLVREHSRRATTGTSLLERLPAFPDAPIQTILQTKVELIEPLSRYRRGVADLTRKLASGPLDPALRVEVDDLWRDDIVPTLNDLRRDLSKTGLVRRTATRLATDAKAVAAGVTGVGLAFGVESVNELAHIAAAGVPAAGAVMIHAAANATCEALSERQSATRHSLYYLVAANDRLC